MMKLNKLSGLVILLFISFSANCQNTDNDTSQYIKKHSGTGFAISSNGYIATNYHVIENAFSIKVKGINGDFSRALTAEVVSIDKKHDLAIIRITDPSIKSLGILPYCIKPDSVEAGESIFVLGYPMTVSMGEEVKVTNGIISSRTGYHGDISTYHVSVPVQPGNSGGPLFSINGNLIGIVCSVLPYTENVTYAVKVGYLNELINLIPNRIPLPSVNLLSNKPLTEQVKALSNFTYLLIVEESKERIGSSFKNDTIRTPSDWEVSAYNHYEQAEKLWKETDYQGAIEQMNLSIETSPLFAGSYFFRGFIYHHGIKNYEKAIADYTTAIQMKSDSSWLYFCRGQAYEDLGLHINAIKDFTKAIELNQDYTDAYFLRALIKSDLKDRAGAISDYDQILRRDTIEPGVYKMATVYNNKGYCLVELDKLDEALPFLNKALQLDSNESYIWGSRGELFYKKGNFKACISDMKKSIEVTDKTAAKNFHPGNAYYWMGLSKIKLGQKEEGCKDLSRAGELGEADAYKAISESCN